MGYSLGIDLGTTFTAAAVWRDGRGEIANLGDRASAIPSVVYLKADETILTGAAAERRAVTESDRVAREFKRRFGDTAPIFLGGSPFSAEALMAKLLSWTYSAITKVEGTEPDEVVVTHPANWGPYKRELLDQAISLSGLSGAQTLTEPEAAAIFYATTERVDPGEVIAVYDLGGGTFDAAILRRTGDGFEILGRPEGIERLGGIDFDAAVYGHVVRALGGEIEQLNAEDPATLAAVARLRIDCVDAKEALSVDTDASIPVMLPSLQTEVRLTRSELEDMIRPAITETIDAMRRALTSAEVEPSQVSAILLVGGSSRIPLVADMVGQAFGRPISVDAHPKYSISLGAAELAGELSAQVTDEVDTAAAALVETSRSVGSEVSDGKTPPPKKPQRSLSRGLVVGIGAVTLIAVLVGVFLTMSSSDNGPATGGAAPLPPVDLTVGAVVTASASLPGFPTAEAVDGDPDTWWGAGDHPPQWIALEFGAEVTVTSLELIVSQDPPGETTHVIEADGVVLETLVAVTADLDVISITPQEPWTGLTSLLIRTEAGPSWVGWREIEVRGIVTGDV